VYVLHVGCCSSKSRQALVSQQALVPVVHQLDSSQSEAIVGSSSDVASPSRSRHMSSDIDEQSSPATSPEVEPVPPVKRPTPHGLVDALSRYFTPSDKRRSRVSLNALPLSSPRSLTSKPRRSITPAANTTHSDETLPLKRGRLKKSSAPFARPSLWKLAGNSVDLVSDRTGLSGSNNNNNNTGDDVQPHCSHESPTSELSPEICPPFESKADIDSNLACCEASFDVHVSEVAKSFVPVCLPSESKPVVESYQARVEESEMAKSEKLGTIGAEPSEPRTSDSMTGLEEMEKLSACDSKQRKRRRTQLSSLHDSLSHFFSAEGERKRTPVQYVDSSEFAFEAYHPALDYYRHVKRVKWKQSPHHRPDQLESRHVGDSVKVSDTSSLSSLAAAAEAAAAAWPSTSYRLSTYHLAGVIFTFLNSLFTCWSGNIEKSENSVGSIGGGSIQKVDRPDLRNKLWCETRRRWGEIWIGVSLPSGGSLERGQCPLPRQFC